MFPLPLIITVEPSRRLRLGIAALHLVAATALWLADLPVSGQVAASVLLAISLVLHGRSVGNVALRGTRNGKLEIRQNSAWLQAALVSNTLLLPFLAILRYRLAEQSRPRWLIILPDSLPREDFRRLRVWIRWLGQQPGKNDTLGEARPEMENPDLESG